MKNTTSIEHEVSQSCDKGDEILKDIYALVRKYKDNPDAILALSSLVSIDLILIALSRQE